MLRMLQVEVKKSSQTQTQTASCCARNEIGLKSLGRAQGESFYSLVHPLGLMTKLIAFLSTGKGTWGHVSRLIETGDWEKVTLLTTDFGKEKFSPDSKTELVVLQSMKGLRELTADIQGALKDRVSGDIAVNIVSGSGKEHMALLAALQKLGTSFTLSAVTKEGVQTI